MKKETRFERVKMFEEFQNSVKAIFEDFKINDEKHKKLDDYYMLSICPRGRTGGINNRLCEIFYGNRPFDIEKNIKSDLSLSERYLIEHGTTLSFCLNDHGYVAIILYPSGTDYTKSTESSIFVENYIHPRKLKNKVFLKKQWIYLNSYMEQTSIEGEPTLKEKLICLYLRYCKNLVIDKKYQRTRLKSYCLKLGNFVLTVGLSGFLVFLFTVLPNRQDKSISKENEQLKEINANLEEIIKLQRQTIDNHLDTNKTKICDFNDTGK